MIRPGAPSPGRREPPTLLPVTARLERHQVAVYLLVSASAAGAGLAWRGLSALDAAITPVLIALLFVTFLAVPLERLLEGLRSWRFLVALAVLNAAVAPLLAWALTRVAGLDDALLVGALLVLLTPCIDYVVAFARLGGGAAERLLAATPLLLLGQILWLPVWLPWLAGPGVIDDLPLAPFLEAFGLLIVLPLALASLIRYAAPRSAPAAAVLRSGPATMVPLTALTLAVVVASQVGSVGPRVGELVPLLPVYAGFAVGMTALGVLVVRALRLDAAGARAAVFSGVTRNSLVVLPLALALPARLDLAPLAVVTQTLVELLVLVLLVPLAPRLLPGRHRSGDRRPITPG